MKGLKAMKNKICDYVIRKYGFENWKTILVCRIFS